MKSGYIKVHRRILDSAIWKNDRDFKLAMTCTLLANWQPSTMQFRNVDKSGDKLDIQRGEFVTSIRTLAKKTGTLSIKQTRTSLKRLEKLEFLVMKKGAQQRAQHGAQRFSFIKVINYDRYNNRPLKKGTTMGTTKGTDRRSSKKSKKKECRGAAPKTPPPSFSNGSKTGRVLCAFMLAKDIDPNDERDPRRTKCLGRRAANQAEAVLQAFGGNAKAAGNFIIDYGEEMKEKDKAWWTLKMAGEDAWERVEKK